MMPASVGTALGSRRLMARQSEGSGLVNPERLSTGPGLIAAPEASREGMTSDSNGRGMSRMVIGAGAAAPETGRLPRDGD